MNLISFSLHRDTQWVSLVSCPHTPVLALRDQLPTASHLHFNSHFPGEPEPASASSLSMTFLYLFWNRTSENM